MTLSNYKRWQNPSDKTYFGTAWELRDGQLDLAVTSDKAIRLDEKKNRFGYRLFTNGRNRTDWDVFTELKALGGFGFNSNEGIPDGGPYKSFIQSMHLNSSTISGYQLVSTDNEVYKVQAALKNTNNFDLSSNNPDTSLGYFDMMMMNEGAFITSIKTSGIWDQRPQVVEVRAFLPIRIYDNWMGSHLDNWKTKITWEGKKPTVSFTFTKNPGTEINTNKTLTYSLPYDTNKKEVLNFQDFAEEIDYYPVPEFTIDLKYKPNGTWFGKGNAGETAVSYVYEKGLSFYNDTIYVQSDTHAKPTLSVTEESNSITLHWTNTEKLNGGFTIYRDGKSWKYITTSYSTRYTITESDGCYEKHRYSIKANSNTSLLKETKQIVDDDSLLILERSHTFTAMYESPKSNEVYFYKNAIPKNLVVKQKVSINSFNIGWDSVPTADRYVYSIDGRENVTLYNEVLISGLTLGEHKIKVKARNVEDANYNITDSDWTEELTFTVEKLAEPVLSVSLQTLLWNDYDNARYKATGFIVYGLFAEGAINDTTVGTVPDEQWDYFNTVSTTYYQLTHVDQDKLTPGVHYFKVRAIITDDYGNEVKTDPAGANWSSGWSNIVKITVDVLDSPIMTFDSNKSIITWNAVENAQYYSIYVNGAQAATTTDTSWNGLNEYVVNTHHDNPGDYQVTMMAMSNMVIYANSDFATPLIYQVRKLSTPVLSLSNTGELSWTASTDELLTPTDTVLYDIYYNGEYLDTIGETTYNIPVSTNQTNIVYVKARCTTQDLTYPRPKHLSSDISNVQNYGKFAKPTGLRTSGDGYLYWDPVDGASKYIVMNNGVKILETYENRYLIPTYTTNTFRFTIKVAATEPDSSGHSVTESDASDVLEVVVKKLDNPTLMIDTLEDYIYWNYITDATVYEIYMNNTLVTTTSGNRFYYKDLAADGENSFYIIANNPSKLIIASDPSNIVKKSTRVSYKNYARIKIDGIYTAAQEIEIPFTLNFKYDDSLDTGTLTLVPNTRSLPYETFSDIEIIMNTDDGNEPFKTYHYLIASDNTIEQYVGNKKLYSHTISLIERSRLLQSIVVPNMTVTQPKDFVISTFRERLQGITPEMNNYKIFGGNTYKTYVAGAGLKNILNQKYPTANLQNWKEGVPNDISTAGNVWYQQFVSGAFNFEIRAWKFWTCYSTGLDGMISDVSTPSAVDAQSSFKLPYFNARTVSSYRVGVGAFSGSDTVDKTTKYLKHHWYIRKHVDRTDQYSKFADNPEVEIATFDGSRDKVFPSFAFMNSEYFRNSSETVWDLIYTIDPVENMHYTYEPYVATEMNGKTHLQKATMNFMYEGDGADLSDYHPFRIVYPRITVGDITETKTYESKVIMLSDVLKKICNIVNTLTYGEEAKYSIDPFILDMTANMPAYQATFNGKTMWEILETLGREFLGIPYLIDDTNVISFHLVGNKEADNVEEITSPEVSTSEIENNASGFITDISNMISKDYYEVYPAEGMWVSPRPTTDGAPYISTTDCGVLVDKPIAYIKKLEVTNWRDGETRPLDITNYLYEKRYYDCLNDNASGKGKAIYWSIGDNKIQGFGILIEEDAFRNALGLASDEYVIQKIIEDATGIKPSSGRVKDLKFRVTYIPYNNYKSYTEQFNTSNYQNNIYKVFNQTDNMISDSAFSASAQKILERTGNNSIKKSYPIANIEEGPQIGDPVLINNTVYYVDRVSYTMNANSTDCDVEYTKNANKINPRMGVDSEYRQYEIYANDYVNRTVNVNHYCYLDNKVLDTNKIKSTRTGIWPLVIEETLSSRPTDTFNQFYVNVYNLDNNGSPVEVSYDNFKGQKKTINNGFALHATRLHMNNTITFTGKMYDNYSAGYLNSVSYSNGKPSLDIIDLGGLNKTNKYLNKAARYVDDYGKMSVVDIALGTPTEAQLYNHKLGSYLYPLTDKIDDPNINSINNCAYYDRLFIDKDNREQLTFTYQMHFKSLNKNYFFHPGFTRYMFKQQNTKISLGEIIFVGYNGLLTNKEFYGYSLGDILGKVVVKTNAEGIKYIEGLTVQPNKSFKGYAVVYKHTPEGRGEILFHYTQDIKANQQTIIQPTYFNFSDIIIEK